jgi:poly(A) polymerase
VPAPTIVPRADHPISRRNVDSEALKVLYRLHESGHIAYLVGGSVRDLLLGRRPKDFDVGTDAHPYQIKKLFRNCWIIGRRFRLAHVKFGPKTIEVATFRRVTEGPGEPAAEPVAVASAAPGDGADIIHRDNTFGTPEEDAFRRDFTINGLFYDIATFSVIDYVGGLRDLDRRVVRSIGDPRVRFVEDPVRMLRAAVMSARLGFDLDPLVSEAIAEHRALIMKASPARLLEEYYKILRSGHAEATFRAMARLRLLELITPELKTPSETIWESLARLDQYRLRFAAPPPQLVNSVLIGALLEPLGLVARTHGHAASGSKDHPERFSFGMLPVARRDVERLAQVRQLGPRLLETDLPTRVARGLALRPAFADTLTWLEVFTDTDEAALSAWRHVRQHRPDESGRAEGGPQPAEDGEQRPGTRRRRRRRRRGRRGRTDGGNRDGGNRV